MKNHKFKTLAGATVASICLTFISTPAFASASDSAPRGDSSAAQTSLGSGSVGASGGVTEVRNAKGTVIGYKVSDADRKFLDSLSAEMGPNQPATGGAFRAQASISEVALCVAGIAGFIGLTVFPTARAAKIAVQLGKLVKKYGVKKMAEILKRAYKGTDRGAQKEILDFAKQAAGIGALAPCGI